MLAGRKHQQMKNARSREEETNRREEFHCSGPPPQTGSRVSFAEQQQPSSSSVTQSNTNSNSSSRGLMDNSSGSSSRRILGAFDARASVAVHRNVSEALEDPTSELNAFLNIADGKSLMTSKSWFYSLILEPNHVRSDRIMLLTEAFAVFGALFLNAIWFVWEFGKSQDFDNAVLHRVFDLVSAVGIASNTFLAMWSGFLWIMSILYAGSQKSWVFGARHYLVFLFHLLICILFTTVISVAIAVYNTLKNNLPEMIIAITFTCVVFYEGMYQTAMLVATQIPLEYRHFPIWLRYTLLPFPYFQRGLKKQIEEQAKARAEVLRNRAKLEHTLGDTTTSNEKEESDKELERLLKAAAHNINKPNLNVIPYLVKLRHELYDDVESLEEETIDSLSYYMPRRLAKAVYEILQQERDSSCRARVMPLVVGGRTPSPPLLYGDDIEDTV